MAETHILLTVMIGGFTVVFGTFLLLFKKIDKLDDKVNNIDKSLIEIKTVLHMKDCCMLKDDRVKQKAE